MNYNIVFLDEYSVDDSDLSVIKKLGNYTGYENTESGQIIDRCREADIVITNKTPLKADTIASLPDLKLICIAATGMNNVDLEAAAAAGITVRNTVDYSTHSVAEQTLAGVLALLKQTLYLDRFVKSGDYSGADRLFNFDRPTFELHGKKWGIIGLGNIGRQVASIVGAFGCEVSYFSASGTDRPEPWPQVGLEVLLRDSDIVSIHAPLSKQTYHLINKENIVLMKPTAIIANMARGSIVEEQALAEALNDGLIAGAALDVYSSEPLPADNPLFGVKDKYKLVLSPHSAWHTKEARQRLVNKIANNIEEFLSRK